MYMYDVTRLVADPDLVYEQCVERAEGFDGAIDFFPANYNPRVVQPQLSGITCVNYIKMKPLCSFRAYTMAHQYKI